MNKYQAIADSLEEEFIDQDLQVNIIVGTTDNIKWEDVVTDGTTTFCVLLPAGGNTVKTNENFIVTEYLTLALALPNENMETYSEALEKIQTSINRFIQQPFELGSDVYLFGNNGLQANDFRVVRGHHIALMTQNLMFSRANNMIDTAGAIVTITACDTDTNDPNYNDTTDTLFCMFHYSMGRTKNYDPTPTQGSDEIQKAFQSEDITVVFDYYKIRENVLHRALSKSNKTYYYITINDGDEAIISNKKMYLSSYFQDGVVGGYTSAKVTFTSGVLPDLT